MSRIKKSFLKEVKVEDVMEELKASNYFDKAHLEMVACINDTLEYKQMQEVAVTHMFNTLTNTSPLSREEKKNQIARIGYLASQMCSSITKTLSERLSQEATVTAKRALRRLADKNSGNSEPVNTRGKKRKLNDSSFEDSESDVSLDGISDNSVSSVHTSDLSSFDDEIVVTSEDEKGGKKEKRISFKTANKAYFDNGFSKIRNVIAGQKNKTDGAPKDSESEKNFLSDSLGKSKEPKNITPRPKRERKPNSKYSPEDMHF